jgi:proteasome beta subunit
MYDVRGDEGHIYFYDALGAQFEVTDFATTGSGAAAIRGVMYYTNRWSGTSYPELSRDDAVGLTLRLLFTAAEYDSATGRYERSTDILPTVKTITADGQADVTEDELRDLHTQFLD